MNTQDHNRKDREDIPRDINADEIGFEPSAKKLKALEKIDIKESELGRELSQKPYEEHIEESHSQIDKATILLQQQKKENPDNSVKDEINENDNRDLKDSTKDWDAENNKTGRHK